MWSAVLILGVTFLVFTLFFLIPASPGRLVVGERAPKSEVDRANRALGVDRPVHVQYADFLWRLLHGDLGRSYGRDVDRIPVGPAIRAAAFVTSSLVLGAFAIVVVVGFALGSYTALRPSSRTGRAGEVALLVGLAMPPIVTAYVLQFLFGVQWPILPEGGYCTFLPAPGPCSGPIDWASHLALPWITLALFFIALYARLIKSSVLDVLNEPYVQTAWAKGASARRVLVRHVLRNALLPVVTVLGIDLGLAASVGMFIEVVFGLPGLGSQTLGALQGFRGFDLPFVTGILLVTSGAIVVLNLIVDLGYLWLDPRIRVARGRRSS